MTRSQQRQIKLDTLNRIAQWQRRSINITPTYLAVITLLNSEGYRNGKGSKWTRRGLYQMLFRAGYRGLKGFFRSDRNWQFILYLLPQK